MLVASLGLLVSGCETTRQSTVASRPFWPVSPSTEKAMAAGLVPRPHRSQAFVPAPPPTTPAPGADRGAVQAIPRTQWTDARPIPARVNAMDGVRRITVHHEGWRTVWFTDASRTADRIEQIRKVHTDPPRGWGDIGYHYIVDRAGRIWEGRPVGYQGAHVKAQNEHNLGVLVLGNFEQQSPTQAQLGSLTAALRSLMTQHRVSLSQVYTHKELNPTACPGRFLQPSVESIRSRYL